jgi:hypothetical protein
MMIMKKLDCVVQFSLESVAIAWLVSEAIVGLQVERAHQHTAELSFTDNDTN